MARSQAAQQVVFPVGRMLMGSMYKASDKDADGKPRIVKTGQNAGQPTQQFFFAFGVPKTPGVAHWGNEVWGAIIWAVGNLAFPKIAENPAFAWKIVDGDSTVPNKKNIKPCDREGYPGNWVVSCASTYAPKIVTTDSSGFLLEADAVMPGDFIQVQATVDGNNSTQNPGIYINHDAVRFVGYSALGRIKTNAIDPTAIAWGNQAAPAGLVSAPVGAAPGVPATPSVPAAAPAAAKPPATAVTPSPSFLKPPGAAPGLPGAPKAPVKTMLGAAAAFTYEQMIAEGWDDAKLVTAGYMAAA